MSCMRLLLLLIILSSLPPPAPPTLSTMSNTQCQALTGIKTANNINRNNRLFIPPPPIHLCFVLIIINCTNGIMDHFDANELQFEWGKN